MLDLDWLFVLSRLHLGLSFSNLYLLRLSLLRLSLFRLSLLLLLLLLLLLYVVRLPQVEANVFALLWRDLILLNAVVCGLDNQRFESVSDNQTQLEVRPRARPSGDVERVEWLAV